LKAAHAQHAGFLNFIGKKPTLNRVICQPIQLVTRNLNP
jgi:hypothetical protein